uniref:Ubiquinone biosynthesis protein n=1 Tax=Timema cristinae TaxID=61476 RepID=A0A7R9D8L7_TIMCR|nr:unnamed protein product [Timema cristinae]
MVTSLNTVSMPSVDADITKHLYSKPSVDADITKHSQCALSKRAISSSVPKKLQPPHSEGWDDPVQAGYPGRGELTPSPLPGTQYLYTQQTKLSRHYSSTDNTDSSSKETSSDSSSEESGDEYELNIKENILTASLPFVQNFGWTKHALSAGAESIGYAGVAHGMFPREGAELVLYFCTSCNKKLAEQMKQQTENSGTGPNIHLKPSVFIQDAVEARLRMITPYIDKWPQALGIQTLPPNVPASLANLLTLVDDICYYAGDRSIDFNWYSRRVALAGIYKMTELCLIQDKSEDYQNTWRFLDRRIKDVTHLHGYLHQSEEFSQVAKEAVTATFVTVILRFRHTVQTYHVWGPLQEGKPVVAQQYYKVNFKVSL